MRHAIALVASAVLTACGADGDPIPPAMTTTIGVGNSGVYGATSLTASSGDVAVTVGL